MTRVLAASLLGIMILTPFLALAAPSDTKIDEAKIYYGNVKDFKKPAVIRIQAVFNAIPEYKEALKKGKDDPEYYILMEKANEKFYTTMEKVANDKGYDLIGEVGAIKIKGKKVPVITALLIKELPK